MLSRRALMITAGSLGGVALGYEWFKVEGHFDHRSPANVLASSPFASSLTQLSLLSATEAAVVHVGHSTHLLQLAGQRVLTDPWFFDPAFGVMAHETHIACSVDAVGPLNLILVSHDHPDHADPKALDRLDKRATVVVPTRSGLTSRLRRLGFSEVIELEEFEATTKNSLTITAVPAIHDVREVGFVLSANQRCVLFAGDTAHHSHWRAIRERFAIDLAILPVDGTRIRTGGAWVMTPQEAAHAAAELGAKILMPSHAEAYVNDFLVRNTLVSTIPNAGVAFLEQARRLAPGSQTWLPEAGELLKLS